MLFGALASGCAQRASSAASVPEATSDDLSALEQRLAQRGEQLRALGVAPADHPSESANRDRAADSTADAADTSEMVAAPSATARTSAPSPEAQAKSSQPEPVGDRCAQICEIAAAICSLEQQICGLLARHQDEPRYQSACDRSVADCRAANEACHACTANN